MIPTLGRLRCVRPLCLSRRQWPRLRSGSFARSAHRLLHTLHLRWRRRRDAGALTRIAIQRVTPVMGVASSLTWTVYYHLHFARTQRPWSATSFALEPPSIEARRSAAGEPTDLPSRIHYIWARTGLGGDGR